MINKHLSKGLLLALSMSLCAGVAGCSNEKTSEPTKEVAAVATTEAATKASTEALTEAPTEAATKASEAPTKATEEATEKATEKATEEMTEGEEDMITMNCPVAYGTKKVGVAYGTVEKITYYSTTCEKDRPANVLLPANYDPNKQYPVAYCLHGIFGSENDMVNTTSVIIGNLAAEGLAEEMIVVFPYMYASKTQDQCTAIDEKNIDAYDNFVNDLRDDLMPYIKEHYPILEGRENTAIMGFSMGGRESIAIGLILQEQIGYICAISPAPGIVEGTDQFAYHKGQFVKSELVFTTKPYLFMLCCGDKDTVVGTFPKSYHELFTENEQEHIWWEIKGAGHDDSAIKSGIYNFARRVFREENRTQE